MRVLVNGQPKDLEQGASVRAAAAAIGIKPEARGVAVAVDGEVVPRADLDSTPLADGQRVEIVAAIQGGARSARRPSDPLSSSAAAPGDPA